MRRMRATRGAELLDHELLGLLFLVFACRVVTPFAAITRQTYQISHRSVASPLSALSPAKPCHRRLDTADPVACRGGGVPRGRGILQAHDGIRTRDLFLTKEVLYRLSYMGPMSSRAQVCRSSGDPRGTMRLCGAGNGIRTRDPELGRLALYQLSYSRPPRRQNKSPAITGGEGRIRTSEGISRQIYSLLPLATREPLRSESTRVPEPMGGFEPSTY